MRNTPKVVGGLTLSCTEAAEIFYGKICDQVIKAASAREAEMAKLLENTYRQVNIALVNETAIFSHELGVDLWDAIRCAATKPFGFQAFYPGPGIGGHCIPIDPNYLSHRVRTLGCPSRFVELAQETNGADPYVRERQVDGHPIENTGLSADAVEAADLVILLQARSAFDLDALASHAQAFLDTRAGPTADIAADPGGSQPADEDHRVTDTVGATGRPGCSCSGRARPAARAAKRRRRTHFSGNAPLASAGLWSRRGRGGNEGKGESESR
jgi:UDP-N-acetyl-D-mannosaminuronate dehydrogenase